jgi:ADP-heptose:LPS heptosyltransferase
MTEQKRILIVRPDRIGDVVLSTSLPREIKRRFPDSYVALLLRKYTRDIYINNPFVDNIILIDDEGYLPGSMRWFLRKRKEIRQEKFSHSLTLLPTEQLNYLLFLAGIPYRVGVGHKFYQFITMTKYVDRKKYIPLRHEADYCMDLARKIGVVSENFAPEIFLSSHEKEKAAVIRKALLGNRKYLIGIHATSGNSAPNWMPGDYSELIAKLKKNKEIQIAVTDNNVPLDLTEIEDVVYPNRGASLRESILNFAGLDLLISASTGPMHIAAALKVKTLSMFCPLAACSPKLWGPLGNEGRVILPDEAYCRIECPGDPKKCTFEGNGGIDTGKILDCLYSFLPESM